MHEFKMPSLGSSMEDGTVTEWKVQPGDKVERGDIVCEVETQKGDIDVEIWESGTLAEILVEPGRKVPVGEVLALVDIGAEAAAGEVPEEPVEEPEKPKAPEEPEEPEAPEAEVVVEEPEVETQPRSERPTLPMPTASGRGDTRVKASPAARRLAGELDIDLKDVAGTGPEGAVTVEDVEVYKRRTDSGEQPAVEEAPEHHVRVSPMARRLADELDVDTDSIDGTGEHGAVTRSDVERAAGRAPAHVEEAVGEGEDRYTELRKAIARAMERSKREIPHYYLEETVDMKAARDWLTARNAERPPTERVLMSVLVAKAVARAADDMPEFNGFYEDEQYRPSDAVHLGFAVAMRGGGVVAPAVHDFAGRDLDALMNDVRDLVGRVRGGKLRSSELSDPTITVTNLGDQGVEKVYGVIYPPQVAIVGVGKISERPLAKDDMVGAHPVATFTLSADHRVSDGISGAKFLRRIAELLQEPQNL